MIQQNEPPNPGVDAGLVLEEGHVQPGPLRSVVEGVASFPALGAGTNPRERISGFARFCGSLVLQ